MHASPEKGIAWRAATRLGIVEIIKAPPKKILCGRCEVLLRDGAKVERDLEIQRPARRSWDLGDGSDGAGGERAKVAVAEKGGVSEADVLLHREADNVLKPIWTRGTRKYADQHGMSSSLSKTARSGTVVVAFVEANEEKRVK